MSDLRSKTLVMYDYGLFVSWAVKLAQTFGRVLYYCPFKSAFPKSQQFAIGTGLEGVERIVNFFDHIHEADCFFFPDVYDGDLQVYLREQGFPVWGSAKAEELELFRWQTKMLLKKDLKLPVQPVERILGITDLREFLKENDNKFVKISMLRGDFETFHHETYNLSEPLLDEIEMKLGPYKEDKEFIVEDAIDNAVEIGYDGFTIDGRFPSVSMQGYEIKDVCLLGAVRPYASLPPPVREVNDKLSPVFQSYGYRGFWSSEIRIPKDGRPYLTDPCCRAGSPPSELYQELYSNWGEIIWGGAHGELVTPKPVAKFGIEVLLHSDWADQHWQAVYLEPEVRRWVKLRNLCQRDETWYVAPQTVGLPEIGAVVAVDDTLLGAVKKVKAYCSKVSGFRLSKNLETIPQAFEAVRDGNQKGVRFTDAPVPTEQAVAHALSN